MEDGKLAAVVTDTNGMNMVEILTKVDPETVAARKTLTLGSYFLITKSASRSSPSISRARM
jgi:hypothetical protein